MTQREYLEILKVGAMEELKREAGEPPVQYTARMAIEDRLNFNDVWGWRQNILATYKLTKEGHEAIRDEAGEWFEKGMPIPEELTTKQLSRMIDLMKENKIGAAYVLSHYTPETLLSRAMGLGVDNG